jgi:hypothetical protein
VRHRLSNLVIAAAVVLALVAVVVRACTDDDGGPSSGADRQRTEAAIRRAHAAADQARLDSAAPPSPNPELPALARTSTGPALTEWVRVTTRLQSLGMALRSPPGSRRKVTIGAVHVDSGGDRATLDVCTVSDGEVLLVSSGQVVSSGLRSTRTHETMVRQGHTWRLSDREVVKIDDGATCEPGGSSSDRPNP